MKVETMVGTLEMDYDVVVSEVGRMSREDLVQSIQDFRGRFKLDFTEDYLERQSDENLKHILLAAKLQQLFGPDDLC